MNDNRIESIRNRDALLRIFKRVERYLWVANIEPGLPRFFELATLLFLKLLAEYRKDPSWEPLKSTANKICHLNQTIIPHLQERYQAHGIFLPTQIGQDRILKNVVDLLDNHSLSSLDSDILGDAYEYFLRGNISSKQSLGQFFTPRPLVKALIALASPTNNDTVYDPFCGAGGLLVGASNYVKGVGSLKANMFFGKDAATSTRVAKMNALLHWGDPSGIEQVTNTLAHPVHQKYSVGVANVPFARDPKNYPYDALYENGLAGKKTDMLCILHLFQAIRQGGRMAAIVPEGFLFGTERAKARRFLTDNANLRLVASLPHGMFRPYTNVKTAIIYLDNIRCPTRQKHFWYFDVQDEATLGTLAAFHGTPEEKLPSLGYVKVDREAVHRNAENWIGKHYQDSSNADSKYPLVPLGKLVTFVSTGFSYKMAQLSDNGIPLFTLKSVKKDFFPRYETKYLRYETQTDEKNACLPGDILVAMKDKNRESPILGRATIANRNGVFSSDLAKVEVTAKNALSSEYLYYCFKSDAYVNEIKKFSAGSIVKSICLEDMASIKIPLPPLAVQIEVVKEFNRYEKLILAQNEAANLLYEKCRERLKSLWV